MTQKGQTYDSESGPFQLKPFYDLNLFLKSN